jgi:hypothetical protein
MAYDDDGSSIWDWREFEDLATILERYLASGENLNVAKLSALVAAAHTVGGGRGVNEVPIAQLADHLREQGLGSVPFETVIRALDTVTGVDADADVLNHITLRDAQRIMQR